MKIVTYTVQPNIPEPLKPLDVLAHNLWISWNFDAIMLFIRLDYDLWIQSHQNPVRLLGMVSQERYDELSADDSYLAALNEVYRRFRTYLDGETWYEGEREKHIAYFSMEYGMDVSLPIYSGGLGILSGDHMKTASDLGLPLVGVGLLYRQGYFQQYLNADGFQQESYPENDWYNMPVNQVPDAKGEPVRISVDMAGSQVIAQVWEAKVGRTSLYLLDTNIEENSPENRIITTTLYGGDREMRIRQEILLGIGGIRALRALGINPAVVHMNEGHSAFLGIERIRELVTEKKLSFTEAVQTIWPTTIFTTHTPVPAGNERFAPELIEKYFRRMVEEIGLEWRRFLGLGRENPGDDQEPFCMTVLALRLSAYNNGVSRLHGEVSREMWKDIWKGLPLDEVPIGSITNGVHPRTWLSHNMLDLLDRYFGPRFREEPTNLQIWDRIDRISDEELWRTHERRKERLVVFARYRLHHQIENRGGSSAQIAQAEEVLSPYTLTISFARRFATYKRATLLFRDPDRLIRLLTDSERPIQIIFAGKAHPHDIPGKQLIKDIVHFASQPEVRSKIIFLENYDMTVARYLVSGSDLWLNTPRRPLEASGTSGMKAAVNGVLNVSVLDGWWAEAYNPRVGWAIGRDEEYDDPEIQDEIESKALYDLLEREIIPSYYNRGRDGLPREWIRKMKDSIREIGKQFSSHRMLMEYSRQFYFPALKSYDTFYGNGFETPKRIAAYLGRLQQNWQQVRIEEVCCEPGRTLRVGDRLQVRARVALAGLSPEEVTVEAFHGLMGAPEGWKTHERTEMRMEQKTGDRYEYSVELPCGKTGRQGYAVRILPHHPDLVHPLLPDLVRWA